MHSLFANVGLNRDLWNIQLQHEAQDEIEKLKEELLRVRRIEKQKDREVLFLQKQLSAAAARLSRTESIEENLNG